ncbi:hypothetical protein F9K33_03260 [bacterium]|nr:MAG: hypothetical protein F9K33_03260 [bacterium]
MARSFHDNDRDWENEKEGDEEEPWKKAHEEWKTNIEKEALSDSMIASDQSFADSLRYAWDENAWEKFIQSLDKEGLRVIAFYEKYWSHSDRDRMVEEAMAMFYVREAFKQKKPANAKEYYFKYYIERELLDMGVFDEGFQGFLDAKENSLYRISAYRLSREFYNQIRAWVHSLLPEIRTHKLLEELQNTTSAACTKLAGAHVMGYQPHTIGGNIAQCKRALKGMSRAIDLLSEIQHLNWMDQDKYFYYQEIATEARSAIAIRIVDLRNQFFDETSS